MMVASSSGPQLERPRQWAARVEGRGLSLRVRPVSACRTHDSGNRSVLLSSFYTSNLYNTVQKYAQSVNVSFLGHRDRTAPHRAALPNHRTYGSRIRRFGWSGQTNVPWRLPGRAVGNAIAVIARCPYGLCVLETMSLTCHYHLPSRLGLAPFRPSMVAIRLGLSVSPPFGLECLTSLA